MGQENTIVTVSATDTRPDHFFELKRGDTLPVIRRVLRSADGTIQDLTTATSVDFVHAPKDGEVPDFATAVTRTATIIGSATDGLVEYAWVAADTAVAGDRLAEFQVNFPSGGKLTFPNGTRDYILVRVTQDVDNA